VEIVGLPLSGPIASNRAVANTIRILVQYYRMLGKPSYVIDMVYPPQRRPCEHHASDTEDQLVLIVLIPFILNLSLVSGT
jgi:hypothetical protein